MEGEREANTTSPHGQPLTWTARRTPAPFSVRVHGLASAGAADRDCATRSAIHASTSEASQPTERGPRWIAFGNRPSAMAW